MSALHAFYLDGAPVLGRYARLEPPLLDAILRRHDYPRPAALVLGEALTLAALAAGLFKTAERFTLQTEGDGLIRLLVAEWRAGGALRGYARLRADAAEAMAERARMTPRELLGGGVLAITLDPGGAAAQVQGAVPLEGDTLAACAEAYFRQSVQAPTRIRLAVAEEISPAGSRWRSGGALIQRVAGDAARGLTDEDWSRAAILFETLEDAELVDPALDAGQALYRLFHEDGVRMDEGAALADACTCDARRLSAVLSRYSAMELADFVEPDGLIHAKCQFCARAYLLAPEDIAAP